MNADAVKLAKELLWEQPNTVGLGWGYPVRGGIRSSEPGVVVLVKEKYADWAEAHANGVRFAPRFVHGVPTDVQATGEIAALSLTAERRPCEPGYSLGNFRITAGTLGCYVRKNGELYALSNNHVLADSNAGVIGDRILQPGAADGGTQSGHWFASLTEYVTINFPGSGGKKNSLPVRLFWSAFREPPNFLARLVGCPYELVIRPRARPQALGQPTPNLVDAAIAKPRLDSFVKPETAIINRKWDALGDAQLGDHVEKVGRTTEHTRGIVTLVAASIRVNYGTAGEAEFSDQVGIEGQNGTTFSQGGDSGSLILFDGTGTALALLFAGGGNLTFGNPIRDVFRLLQLDTTAP